jgi:hypothetical protein
VITSDGFENMARGLATANDLTLDVARRYASLIGDTPELSLDGRVVVRDDKDVEIARVILPIDK